MIKSLKELILPLGVALLTVWGFQYFWLNRSSVPAEQAAYSRDFIAPHAQSACKPLSLEVDFVDAEATSTEAVLTDVETKWGSLTFSTNGAALEQLVFRRPGEPSLSTLRMSPDLERENRCFMVGLNVPTPFHYKLVNNVDLESNIVLTYQAESSVGTIQKVFSIDKEKQIIDLTVSVEPKKQKAEELYLRVLYSSPFVPGVQSETTSAVVFDREGTFEKVATAKLDTQRGWIAPQIFGADDKYFIHAMIADKQHFVQRAYYKMLGAKKLVSILEGPVVTQNSSWTLSFYMGPKEVKSIAAVEPRLEKTLELSGVFAPISKLLLIMLDWLYRYIGNYGLAIIVLTILMKLVLVPFTWRSEQSAKKQKEFQKKLAYLQQKYKNDPDALARERAELIGTHGMPGLGSCLPLLFQMPIFFALSRVLSSSIELYKAPLLWISDLSAPDPYYILPICAGLAMLAQATTVEANQRISFVVVALIVGAVTASLSAGLALYMTVSTILSVAQIFIVRSLKSA
jgi:YidC/Oxa1 family membrane protein insertase